MRAEPCKDCMLSLSEVQLFLTGWGKFAGASTSRLN